MYIQPSTFPLQPSAYAMTPGAGRSSPNEASTQTDASPNAASNPSTTVGKSEGSKECQTCKERKYQDVSNENVSFKSASHVSPESSASKVMAHEMEHVSNAYTKASQAGGKVVSASVTLHSAICPECGRSYISGGETTTRIQYPNNKNPYQQEKKASDSLATTGANIDYSL